MSGNNIPETSKVHQQLPWNILDDHQGIKIRPKFVLELPKESEHVNKEDEDCCKVLNFSSEVSFEKVLMTIDGLDSKKYPQLFIFIIEAKSHGFTADYQQESFEKFKKLQEKLLKFDSKRPMIVQLTSEDENITKLYYKTVYENNLNEIDQSKGSYRNIINFPTFLCSFLGNELENFECEVLSILPKIENSSLILRFLKSLELSEKFYQRIILKVSRNGTKDDLLAILSTGFEDHERIIGTDGEFHISQYLDESSDDSSEENCKSDESSEDESVGSQAESEASSVTSVLHAAVEEKNSDVIDYLITFCTPLIQKLDLVHQTKISTTAFKSKQFEVLCDLLNIADFPFPKNFESHVDNIDHDRLRLITKNRQQFHQAIIEENFEELQKFLEKYSNLKAIYNISNTSAIRSALNEVKLSVYFYLKSFGIPETDLEELEDNLTKEELEEARLCAEKQISKNINEARHDVNNSVFLLSTKSSIHNRKIDNKLELEYRKKILKWLKDIYKIAPEMIDVAASCEDLKIVFDFDCDSIERVTFNKNGRGVYITEYSSIVIGAKLDGNREQQVKGTLAHELCHYVMEMVYNNKRLPYFKNRTDMREEFKEIVQKVSKGLEDSPNNKDGCNGIISRVFSSYSKEQIHSELIVRGVQILSEYAENKEHLEHLQRRYNALFDFWFNYVIPELRKYLQRNKKVINLNKICNFLTKISEENYDFVGKKDMNAIVMHKLVIVKSNIPKLLLCNIYKDLHEKCENMLDSRNLFVKAKKFKNGEILERFKKICKKSSDLFIFVDCSKGAIENLENIFVNKELNFIFFIVSDDKQESELIRIFKQNEMKNAIKQQINYSWSDLTVESQHLVLQTKISFQNDSKISLMDLLNNEEPEGYETNDLSQIIDDQALSLLVEKKEILINTNVENFTNEEKLIYQARRFQKKQNDNNNQLDLLRISQDELLLEVKDQLYVLISDQAGNGKSWAMKNFTKVFREQNPTSWVTYVDLKQFIDEFKAQKGDPEFSNFMVDNILKLENNFESKIFQKMYKNGKVFILFDGFDEIAPNYAEFVSKLAQNFKSNGGNQLWIATRDYFEVDLKKKLKLDITYGLYAMTVKEGVYFIAKSWVLKDLKKDRSEPKSKEEFEESIKMSPNFEGYQQKACEIVEKALISRNNSVGLPQLFTMIADGFKDEKNLDDLQVPKIYISFINTLYKRWLEKGQIREEANVKSQQFELSFYKFHQFHAILSLFPKLAAILFPGYDGSEWKNEIIACGILTIKDEKIYFIHETFREYFVADFIWKKIPNICETVLELFVEILTVEKFEVIRMFLNDMIDNDSILTEIQPKMQNHVAKFYKMTSFYDFFTNNLKNLVDLVFGVLETGDYEQVLEILWNNVWRIAAGSQDSEIFQKFQKFIFNHLNVNDLKELIIQLKVLLLIIRSSLEIEMFEDFVIKMEKMEAKTDKEFITEALMSGDMYNIFYTLSFSLYIDVHKVQKVLEIMEKYLTDDEIFKLMSNCNAGQSVLKICVRKGNKEDLKILWTEIENYFTARKIHQKFKELVKQHNEFNVNILLLFLDYSNRDFSIDFYKPLWELLLKTFEDREELKDFVLQKDYNGFNFVYKLLSRNINQEIFEWTFKILKENFTNTQFQEILQLKSWNEMILLKYAARSSSSEVIKILCNIFPDLCGTNEKFLEMLNESAGNGRNIFHMVVSDSSSEVFEFMIQELEKIASPDKIKEILNQSNRRNRNLLQLAAMSNESLELHKSLWKTIREYCDESEIFDFITNVDNCENNLLFIVLEGNTKEIIELTWNEIKKNLNHDKQVQYLKIKGEDGENLIQYSYRNIFQTNQVTEWVKNLIKEYGIE